MQDGFGDSDQLMDLDFGDDPLFQDDEALFADTPPPRGNDR